MSELAVLIAIVVGVYLFQCICWAPLTATVFHAGIFRKGTRVKRSLAWNALHTAAFRSNPLPLEALLVVNWPGAALSSNGLQLEVDSEPIPWDRVRFRRSGSRLLCGDVPVLQGPVAQLKDYEELMQRLASVKATAREPMVEGWLRKAMDVGTAAKRLEEFHVHARFVAVLACLQLLLLFGVTPWLFSRYGSRAIWMVLASVATASVAITIEFWILHKLFYPKAGDTRLTSAVTILFSPISAIRALDAIGRDLLAGFHPVAAAAVVCGEDEFAAVAGAHLRHLKFGPDPRTWYSEKTKEGILRLIARKGLDNNKLLGPPDRQEECSFYCPLCLAQYLASSAVCADCGHEGLVSF